MKKVSAAVNNRSSFTAGIISFIAILACIILLQFMFQPFMGVQAIPAQRVEFGQAMFQPASPLVSISQEEDPLSIIPTNAGLLVSTIGNGMFLTPSAILPSMHANTMVNSRGHWSFFHVTDVESMPAATMVGYSTTIAEPAMTLPAEPAILVKDTVINE